MERADQTNKKFRRDNGKGEPGQSEFRTYIGKGGSDQSEFRRDHGRADQTNQNSDKTIEKAD